MYLDKAYKTLLNHKFRTNLYEENGGYVQQGTASRLALTCSCLCFFHFWLPFLDLTFLKNFLVLPSVESRAIRLAIAKEWLPILNMRDALYSFKCTYYARESNHVQACYNLPSFDWFNYLSGEQTHTFHWKRTQRNYRHFTSLEIILTLLLT